MYRLLLPVAATLLLLSIAVPGPAFATPVDSGEPKDVRSDESTSDDDDDILKTIFTLGGLLGSSGGDNSPSKTDGETKPEINEFPEEVIPPIKDRDGASAPVPEPTAALLFGFGILAAASRRSLRR